MREKVVVVAAACCIAASRVLASDPQPAQLTLLEESPILLHSEAPCEPAKGTVTLFNGSERVVQVGSVSTSCGCTVVLPEKRTLQPGEFAKLAISVSTLSQPGGVTSSVTVFLQNGEEMSFSVEAEANSCIELIGGGDTWDLGTIEVGARGAAPSFREYLFHREVSAGHVAVAGASDRLDWSLSFEEREGDKTVVRVEAALKEASLLGPVFEPMTLQVLGEEVAGPTVRGHLTCRELRSPTGPVAFGSTRRSVPKSKKVGVVASEGWQVTSVASEPASDFAINPEGSATPFDSTELEVVFRPSKHGQVTGALWINMVSKETGQEKKVGVPLFARAY